MYDAVLFDLDGTLVDTERLAQAAGLAAFATIGRPVDIAFMHSLVGKDGPTTDRIIAAQFPGIDLVNLIAHWDASFAAAMGNGLPVKQGAVDLLTRLSIPCAVVTSSGRENAHRKLSLTGLDAFFQTVVVLEDVTHAKPAPEPFLLGAARLGVDPARCLAFEDSDTGAEAARLAGCTVVQVPDTQPTTGPFAHFLAGDLLSGARMAGLF